MILRSQYIIQFEMLCRFTLNNDLKFGAATLSVDVVHNIFVAWSGEARVVNTAGVDGPLVLFGHDQLDLTPHTVQAVVVGERPKVCDGADLLPVVPGPFQVHVVGVEVLHPTAEDQLPLHLGDLREAGDLQEGRLHWRCVSVCVVKGESRHSQEII